LKTKGLFTATFLYLINSSIAFTEPIEIDCFNKILISDSLPNSDSLIYLKDTNNFHMVDSLTELKTDKSSKKPKNKKSFISSKVESSADDSTIVSTDGQKIFLFGNAKIKYEDIELTAAYIEVDMQQGIMYAEGTIDSVGKPKGQPVFKQGDEEMKAQNLTYNINNEKGYIEGLYTEQQDGFLHSELTKKNPDNSINMLHGKYTTCELEHPHFYIALTEGKVIPGKVIVAGPSYLVIEDIPLYPLAIPFGFFPSSQKRASGFIIPKFGEEKTRGFYLNNGGYYFAINDHVDLTVLGDVYSKGSWQVGVQSRYKLRYKYSGNVSINYSKVVYGEKGGSDYVNKNNYSIKWAHSQDPKARPNSNFSANVNFASSGNNKYNSTTSQDYLTNTISSSIAFRKTFANTPFSTSINLSHSQNNKDSSMSLTLPQMTLTMSRIQPFKRKNAAGKTRWYEDIGISYSGNYQNKVKTHIDSLFYHQTLDKFENGVQHSPSISKSFKLFSYLSLSPSVTYSERWYFKRWKYDAIDENTPITDSTYRIREEKGFYRLYNYNYGASLNTTIYGMVQYKKGPIKAIRHVMTPSVNYTWTPDFSKEKYGFVLFDPRDEKGKATYSPYTGIGSHNAIFGVPPASKGGGSIGLSLSNTLEMKVKSEKDTVNHEKKIALLEGCNLSTSYNILADSCNWNPLSMSARTTLFKSMDINFNASGDFYALDSTGRKTKYYENRINGKLVRITSASLSTGFKIDSKTFSGEEEKNDKEKEKPKEKTTSNNLEEYDYFKIPWNLNVSYSLSYSKSGKTGKITQNLDFNGDFSLTPKWKIGFQSSYDFDAKKFSYTRFSLSRDLHCWAATLSLVPFGPRQSYSFNIAVKSSILQDLKYDKHKSWYDN
jgi:lipopolysaccharide assembly outer membrane protein LptD (OstA)